MAPYRLDILSLFPKSFQFLDSLGVIGRSLDRGIAEIHIHNPRDFTQDRYHKVDDQPYGGGAGMVLKPEPVFSAFKTIPKHKNKRVLLLTPQGRKLHQKDMGRWSENYTQLILICGHYEGFDERIRVLADEEISIGDYVLTGGELPAMVIINGVIRLLPGTLGAQKSLEEESHNDFLLEHPHYTRPNEFLGMSVPEVLTGGDHGAILSWRQNQRIIRTKERRPDLYLKWKSDNPSYVEKEDEEKI